MIGTDILKFIEIAVLVTNGINFLTKNSCQIPIFKKVEKKIQHDELYKEILKSNSFFSM